MSEAFTRTPTGIVAKWQFHDVPTVWVEGPTDILFYPPALRGLKFRLEPFHGCNNAVALVEGITQGDLPYLVILDGDYGILKPKRSVHRRVIILSRHSFENYLWHKDSLNYTCAKHAQSGEQSDVLGGEMARLERHLKEVFRSAIELDVASMACNPAPKLLPENIEQLLANQNGPDVDPVKVANFIGSAADVIPASDVRDARRLVREFLETRPFHELLKGHLLLGVLQKMFCKKASELKGASAPLRQDALVQIVSEVIWITAKDPDYKKLRAKLRKQLSDCAAHPNMLALAAT